MISNFKLGFKCYYLEKNYMTDFGLPFTEHIEEFKNNQNPTNANANGEI
jgi:hypothetical protein